LDLNYLEGQKQHVAIAREMVKNSEIIRLHETNSNLDSEFEKGVQDVLDQVMVDRTQYSSTSLSTIKAAGLIAVVKNGMVETKGNHETVINRGSD